LWVNQVWRLKLRDRARTTLTFALKPPFQVLSGRPGSNRRHSAWKADALPTELLPQFFGTNPKIQYFNKIPLQPPLWENFRGESRIRTCEGENQQIYSLSSLAA